MNSSERFIVEHRPEEARYVLVDRGESTGVGNDVAGAARIDGAAGSVIGEESYVDVATDTGIERVMFHTEVSESYGGQGLAAVLVRAAVDHTIAAGHKIVPVCPYVAEWAKKHLEVTAHMVERRREHLQAIKNL